jgi:hypothetical protein
VNGSFGVGKSSVAEALAAALPNSMIFDPEVIGQMVRYMTIGVLPAEENTDDFQDIALWRTLTVSAAEQLQRQYGRDLIIPMTIAIPAYFKEITTGLRAIDSDYHHFCLIGSVETIKQRLMVRGDQDKPWIMTRVLRYVPIFDQPQYGEHIQTDGLSVQAVTDAILARLGIS